MGWASAIGNIFTGGMVKSVENVALEWIQTDKETEEAKAIKIKALDPNGKMRRDTMSFVCRCYGFYLFFAVPMIFAGMFGLADAETTGAALEAITATFAPITGLFGVLATTSFGVNANNVLQERKTKKHAAK